MALPAGRSPAADGASQVRRYQPPSGCGSEVESGDERFAGTHRPSLPS